MKKGNKEILSDLERWRKKVPIINKFSEIVVKYPEDVAIKTDTEIITYKQLDFEINKIANQIKSHVKNNGHVALLFEQGPDMVMGVLSVLKLGMTYIPLTNHYSQYNIEEMIKDSEAEILITNNKNIELAQKVNRNINKDVKVINIDDIDMKMQNETEKQFNNKCAYILYTSGTTGRPKGVMQNQKNILHYVEQYAKKVNITRGTRMTLFSNFCHDAAVVDIFSGLLNGATLYPRDIRLERDFNSLYKWLKREKIEIWHSVPTLYRHFINEINKNQEKIELSSLKYIVLGGENVLEEDVVSYKKHFRNAKLMNLYGQSESTYNSSQFIYGDTDVEINLGDTIDDIEMYVVDENNEEVIPLGVGEIIVSSPYIALGYWNNEELTNKVFIHEEGYEREYRTGDIGRLELDGRITWLGRKDNQIKIRGYRVELGEIENSIKKIDGIGEVAALAIDSKNKDTSLIVFYTINKEVDLTDNYLRDYTIDKLPSYMIPNKFIIVKEIPLTASGKKDRTQLINIYNGISREATYEEARNNIEKKLIKQWENILNTKKIGINDNFFEIGGHSLKATILCGRIKKEFGAEVGIREIFDNPTIKMLANIIKETPKEEYEILKPLTKQDSYPVSFVQRIVYRIQSLAYKMNKESTGYNMPFAMEILGGIDEKIIEKAINELISKHEALRSSFHYDGKDIVHKIEDESTINIDVMEVNKEEYINEEKYNEAIDKIIRGWIRPFDISQAPLIRAGIIKLVDSAVVLIDTHHIISDGTTTTILAKDLAKILRGEKVEYNKVQFKEYATWEKKQELKGKWDKHTQYWVDMYKNGIPVLELVKDEERERIDENIGNEIAFLVENETLNKIQNKMNKIGGTLYMGLMAGFSILMHKYSGKEDMVIGMPTSGRRHPQSETVAGMFINVLAYRSKPQTEMTIDEFLMQTRDTLMEAYENQDYNCEELLMRVAGERELRRQNLFDVMLVLQNMDSLKMDLGEIKIRQYKRIINGSKFDILMSATESVRRLECTLQYREKLFKKEIIDSMIEDFKLILDVIFEDNNLKIKEVLAIEKAII